MKVPENLLQNYHRLNNDDTDTEDEDKYGLTVGRQIRILNDKSMNDEEKRNKLESIWDQTKKMMDEDEIYVKEQEVKKEKSNKITMLRRELKNQIEKEKKEKQRKRKENITDESEDEMKSKWEKFKNWAQSKEYSRKYEDESEDSDDTEYDQEESEDSDDTEEDQKIDNKKNYVTNKEEENDM